MARVPTGVLIPRKRPEEGWGHLALALTLHLILWDRVSKERGVSQGHRAPEILPSLSPTVQGYRGMTGQPDFLRGCWGSGLRPSLLSRLSSPTLG